MIKIAVDAMGGDNAPHEVVAGAIQATELLDVGVILVGEQQRLESELGKYKGRTARVQVVHASEVIGMDEHPATALRKKKDASIIVATGLVARGQADAVVSCGNTGAQMAAAIFGLGRFPGIERPAIAAIVPKPTGSAVFLDVGANVDVKVPQLLQFALMGKAYCEVGLGYNNPRIAILNNGEEETKGNQVVIAAFAELKDLPINFVGNIEGRDFFGDAADVVVCDGFVGNIVLKLIEGMAFMIMKKLTGRIPNVDELLSDFDYANVGGAPLLGVKGISIVCHGSSKAKAVSNGIAMATRCVKEQLVNRIGQSLANISDQA
ncbi:MAG: phosphate acyltransferase PlsX [Chitinophagales bacterium]